MSSTVLINNRVLFPVGYGLNLIVDGNMEASGVAAYTAGNGADLSKQTNNPHSGVQLLRVARNAVNTPFAWQFILTPGISYRIDGWTRSDGNATPQVSNFGSILWTGTTSTEWQRILFTLNALREEVALIASTSTGTQYCEFDGMFARAII